jgi:hypothetical protein
VSWLLGETQGLSAMLLPTQKTFIHNKYDIMRENTQMTLRNWKSQADMWDNVLQK